jgi:hypothetical protein
MALYPLPYFGGIDMSAIEEDYRIKAMIGEREIRLDINFNNKAADETTMKRIERFLKSIEQIDQENQKHYREDFKRKGVTAEYVEMYLEEFPEEELANLVDRKQSLKTQRMQLLNQLELKRIGMYPDESQESECFGVFDYSIKIEGEYCNQLLVVITKDTGELDHITWES